MNEARIISTAVRGGPRKPSLGHKPWVLTTHYKWEVMHDRRSEDVGVGAPPFDQDYRHYTGELVNDNFCIGGRQRTRAFRRTDVRLHGKLFCHRHGDPVRVSLVEGRGGRMKMICPMCNAEGVRGGLPRTPDEYSMQFFDSGDPANTDEDRRMLENAWTIDQGQFPEVAQSVDELRSVVFNDQPGDFVPPRILVTSRKTPRPDYNKAWIRGQVLQVLAARRGKSLDMQRLPMGVTSARVLDREVEVDENSVTGVIELKFEDGSSWQYEVLPGFTTDLPQGGEVDLAPGSLIMRIEEPHEFADFDEAWRARPNVVEAVVNAVIEEAVNEVYPNLYGTDIRMVTAVPDDAETWIQPVTYVRAINPLSLAGSDGPIHWDFRTLPPGWQPERRRRSSWGGNLSPVHRRRPAGAPTVHELLSRDPFPAAPVRDGEAVLYTSDGPVHVPVAEGPEPEPPREPETVQEAIAAAAEHLHDVGGEG
jgi:hypothetical protein